MAALLLCLLGTALAASEKIESSIVIARVLRNIDLTTSQTHVELELTLSNTGNSAVSSFLFSETADEAAQRAFIAATQGSAPLTVAPVSVSGAPQGAVFHKVTLDKPLPAGEEADVVVSVVYTGQQTPFPAEINQFQMQLVLFRNNHYVYSPYTVTSQTTIVKLFSSSNGAVVESHSQEGATSLVRDKLNYGPYTRIAPFSVSQMQIHFENNSPFLEASVVREIWISHWGTVAVKETFDLKHTGAKLSTGFSRFDYQRSGQVSASVRDIQGLLPAFAEEIYYRDQIGNISTSHVNQNDDGSISVTLRPRFPLFGGWGIDFYWGYNIDSVYAISTQDGLFVLDMPFSTVFPSIVVRSLTVKVVLPEGAEFSEARLPFDAQRKTGDSIVSFLDSTGRPVVTFTKSNVVKEHLQNFQVSYHFSAAKQLREPLTIVATILLVLALGLLYIRLDFSLSPSEATTSASKKRD